MRNFLARLAAERRVAWFAGVGLLVVVIVASTALADALQGDARVAAGPPVATSAKGTPPPLHTLADPNDPSCHLLRRGPEAPPLSGAAESSLRLLCGEGTTVSSVAPAGAAEIMPAGLDGSTNDPLADFYPVMTQSEPTVAVAGNTVVAAWNDSGSIFDASFSGYGRSTDGGATFTDLGFVPPTSVGDTCWGPRNLGDPVLATYDADTFYFSALALYFLTESPPCDFVLLDVVSCVGISKSTDAGLTFGEPTLIGCESISTSFQDKEWMTVDRTGASFDGNVYVCWTRFSEFGTQILFSRSVDGGATFSGPTPLSDPDDGVQGCQVAIGPAGKVYVAWEHYGPDPLSQHIRRSDDGGVTFGTEMLVSTTLPVGAFDQTGCGRPVLRGHIRIAEFPALAVNPTNGEVYVAWNDGRAGFGNADVLFSRSTDGGATWSPPGKVNNDSTVTDQFMPAIAVAPNGTIKVTWYDRRLDPASNLRMDLFAALSADGGTTWSNERVTDVSFGVPPIWPGNFDFFVAACYMGDYNSIAADADRFYMVWGDNRNLVADGPIDIHPQPDVFFDTESATPCSSRGRCPTPTLVPTLTPTPTATAKRR